MRLLESEKRVVDAATHLADTLGSDSNHTVAAAAMDIHGSIFMGVNAFHFTGGPCAELVVLGAAAAAGSGPLMTIVAAGDRRRGVLAPCGRCPQVLVDQHPDVVVIVPAGSESGSDVEAHPIRALLPFAYHFPDAKAERFVRFHRRYRDAIASGVKTATVRWNDPVQVGSAMLVFEDDDRGPLAAVVDRVQARRFDALTDEDARRENGDTADDLRRGLRTHYPSISDDAIVDVVTFHLDDRGRIAHAGS